MQTKFQVLMSDPRYLDLTDEQLDLMYEHYLIDNPDVSKEANKDDPDYEEPHSYYDPDFDDEWNRDDDDDEDPTEELSFNEAEQKDLDRVNKVLDELKNSKEKSENDFEDTDDWEEV